MSAKEKSVVITSALRTAIGTFNGSLKNMQAHDLGSIVVKENIKRSKLKSNEIDEIIMGQVLTSATGQNPARQAAIKAGIPIGKIQQNENQTSVYFFADFSQLRYVEVLSYMQETN